MKKYQGVLLVFLALFLASCTATPKIYLKSGDMSMELKRSAHFVRAVAYSRDGRYALTGAFDKTLRLWDISTGRQIKQFKGHTGVIYSAVFSPDGKYVLSGSGDMTVRLWDVATGSEVRRFIAGKTGMFNVVWSVAFSPDSKQALSSGAKDNYEDSGIRLWDVTTGEEIMRFKRLEKRDSFMAPNSIVFSPDGKHILSGSSDVTIRLWHVATGSEVRQFTFSEKQGMFAWVWSVAFSPDGKYVLSGSNSGVRLWEVSTGKELRTFKGDAGAVTSVAFSPDGKQAVSVSISGFIKLWDIATGNEIRQFTSDDKTSMNTDNRTVVFSPDGKFILSGGDASTRIWNVSTGEEVATMIGFEDGEWLVITPSGYYNSSENGDKYLTVKVGGNPYTIEQLRESFFRPDLVQTALTGGSLENRKKLADVKQPPLVAIVDTPKSSDKDEAKVTLKIEDQGGGVGDIRLYLNGSAVVLDMSRGVKLVEKNNNAVYKTYTVKLANGVNAIKAMVFNADNTMNSTEAMHEITASLRTFAKPSLYALVVGINEYKTPDLQLKYAVADAELFTESIQKAASGLFEKVVVKKLTSKVETTQENILKELKSAQLLNPEDVFVFYVASHGIVDDGKYFLISSNVGYNAGSVSTAKLQTDAISQTSIKELIANIPASKKMLVIDTCNAGALGSSIVSAVAPMKVLSHAVGSTILSASLSTQEANEGYKKHGLFTYIISEGLDGKADANKDGFVRTIELAAYVDNEVPALAEKFFKRTQNPTVSNDGMAFPIGKVR